MGSSRRVAGDGVSPGSRGPATRPPPGGQSDAAI